MTLQLRGDLAQNRYRKLSDQVRQQFPSPDGRCVVRGTGVKTSSFDANFEDADLYLGSHVDEDPRTEDKIHVLSYHKEPTGGETIMEEFFTERQEKPNLFSRKTQMLHVYALRLHSPGGSLTEAALASIDLGTGKVIRQETGARAMDGIQRLGLEFRPAG